MLLYSDLPCGEAIPDSPHAVSVSFPNLRDVIGYEEEKVNTLNKLKLGYPRFLKHPFVAAAEKHIKQKYKLSGSVVALLAGQKSAPWIEDFVGKPEKIIQENNIVAVSYFPSAETEQKIKAFLQHTGTGISSRQAEDYLVSEGVAATPATEEIHIGNSTELIYSELARLYGADTSDVSLTPFGMSAFFSAFQSINAIQKPANKKRWLQLGWLYLDTIRILEKFSPEPLIHLDLTDLQGLEKLFEKHSEEIAGIVTEVPTNPLIQTPNLPKIYELAKKYNVILVVDSTLGTPVNLNLLPYSDIVIESLTKFASGSADVAMGATILNPQSQWYEQIKTELPQHIIAPYSRDIDRLAYLIPNYEERMQKIGKNTIDLVQDLKSLRGIKKIHWALGGPTADNYKNLMRNDQAVTGVISLEFEQNFEKVYDKLQMAKGPSFGTEFTLAMPYMYMAHYDLVSTPAGQEQLKKSGLSPDLLRISVGLDDPAEIAETIEKALA